MYLMQQYNVQSIVLHYNLLRFFDDPHQTKKWLK